jgi:hypothetical protein
MWLPIRDRADAMNRSRLEKLEAVVRVTRTDRGAYCRACGGLTIEDALLARDTIRKGGNRMPADDAAGEYQAMAEGDDGCRRCGAQTLVGALRAARDGAAEDVAA